MTNQQAPMTRQAIVEGLRSLLRRHSNAYVDAMPFKDERAALGAAIAALEASAWQPMETAPKDGRTLLLFWPYWAKDEPCIGEWDESRWRSDAALVDWFTPPPAGDSGPTHWMPLPSPPEHTPQEPR